MSAATATWRSQAATGSRSSAPARALLPATGGWHIGIQRTRSRAARPEDRPHDDDLVLGGVVFPYRQPRPGLCAGASGWLEPGKGRTQRRHRSEEHTSELQSLMRISYAVFCMKKKNIKKLRHYKNRRRPHKE